MQRVKAAMEANRDPTEHHTLHLDCMNAFNSVNRAAAAECAGQPATLAAHITD